MKKKAVANAKKKNAKEIEEGEGQVKIYVLKTLTAFD